MPSNPDRLDKARASRLKKLWDTHARKHSLTQSKAAQKLGITQGQVSHYLLGRVPLTPQIVGAFAALLGFDPALVEPSWDYTPTLPHGLTVEGYQMALEWQRLPLAAREDFARLLRTIGGNEAYTGFLTRSKKSVAA